jgi:large subunit ribosomal protein L4
MQANVYNQEGKEIRNITLPEEVFGVKWNADLVHQVVTAMMANKRQSTANTKFRSEVSGTGKKPWKQKGTGRARHGSRRSPIWVGGGVAHGPRSEKDYSQKINRKMRDGALFSVLSKKFKEGEIVFIDSISFDEPKTAKAKEVLGNLAKIKGLESLATRRKNAFLLAADKKEKNLAKSFTNFSNGMVDEIRNLNPMNLLNYKYIVLVNPEAAMSFLSGKKLLKSKTKAK